MKTFALASILLVASLAGCRRDNPYYCAPGAAEDSQGNPCPDGGGGGSDGGIDAAHYCGSNDDCAGSATGNVCDVAATPHPACVECTADDPQACSGTKPVCGSDDTCRACEVHSDCSSDVCLPNGACDDGSDVAYVDGGSGAGSDCTQVAPCKTITIALGTGRPVIKVTGSVNDQVSIANQTVTILADPGAQLMSTSNGVLLTFGATSTGSAAIYDLEIEGASGGAAPGNPGILLLTGNTATLSLTRVKVDGNKGGGISATGGTITLDQSTISGNSAAGISATGGTITLTRSTISGNTGGGISLTGTQFHIENSFVTQNISTGTFGGISIGGISTAGTYELDFDTIAGNFVSGGLVAGVQCGTIIQPVAVDSDIIYGNSNTNGTTSTQLTAYDDGVSECVPTYSDLGGSGSATGSGNFNADPSFIDDTDNPGNFHIHTTSPAVGVADPALSVGSDFDGDARPTPAAVGADQP